MKVSPVTWAPSFTRFEFLFWRFVKDIVYNEKVQMRMSCVTELSDLQRVTNEMPASTWQKGEHQLDVFPAINGAHTEIY
jgi:hypothetical protein